MLRPSVELVSATSSRAAGNSSSSDIGILAAAVSGTIERLIAVSQSGRFIAFVSRASDLATTDTNTQNDVFVRDRLTGMTTLVSINRSGTDSANDASYNPLLSQDGRYIVFTSYANNLVANDSNTGEVAGSPPRTSASDIFVRDLVTGVTSLISVNSSGTASGNSYSYSPVMSGDARYIAFRSNSSDLVATDTNARDDIFVRDRVTGITTLVSVNSSGTDSSNGTSSRPFISENGRFVAFNSSANNLVTNDTNSSINDVFIRDLVAGTTTLVSVNASGTGSGDRNSTVLGISDDGRSILFVSFASNLVANDTNGNAPDFFVRDVVTGTTTLVSINNSGTGSGNNPITQILPIGFSAVMSGNGRYVAFGSNASDLVPTDTNNKVDIFVRDLELGTTRLVTINQIGTDSANQESVLGGISDDGRYITFSSYASDLVRGDTDGSFDIFVRDIVTETTFLISAEADGVTPIVNESFIPVISGDGSYVAFSSLGSGLVTTDTNNESDVYGTQLPPTELGIAPAPIQFNGGKPGLRRRGTGNNNVLIGTPNRDVLQGLGGNDRLFGLQGNDRLLGGIGNDRIWGNHGNDLLLGGAGNDRLNGGKGRDRLLGESGNDVLIGGSQNDVLEGGSGNDMLRGGRGRDVFIFDELALTGLSNADAIADFNVTEDWIDLRSIFATSAFNRSAPFARFTQFVQVIQVGADTQLQIDQDGNGIGSNFVTIATLQNLSANTLSSRNFIIV